MHLKRSAKKVVLELNKQTIANLNNWEMIKVGAGLGAGTTNVNSIAPCLQENADDTEGESVLESCTDPNGCNEHNTMEAGITPPKVN